MNTAKMFREESPHDILDSTVNVLRLLDELIGESQDFNLSEDAHSGLCCVLVNVGNAIERANEELRKEKKVTRPRPRLVREASTT